MWLTVGVFAITVIFLMWRPRGINESISTTAGAFILLAAGVVPLTDLITIFNIVSGAAVTILSTIVMSLVLDSVGVFRWVALNLIERVNGSGRKLFWYVILLCFLMTIFFNNDGSILITTPIIIQICSMLKLKPHQKIPYLLSGALIATASSAPIGVSNLANLIALNIVGLDLNSYTLIMFVPSMIGIATIAMLLYLYFRKQIPVTISRNPARDYSLVNIHPLQQPTESRTQIDWWLFRVSICIVVLFRAGVKDIVTKTPWHILLFAFSIYIIVKSLDNAGLTAALINGLQPFAGMGEASLIAAFGLLLTLLSNIVNNLPSVMIGTLAVLGMGLDPQHVHLAYMATIIGSDIGSLLTPVGTLATLIWMFMLRSSKIHITWKQYMRVTFIVIPVELKISGYKIPIIGELIDVGSDILVLYSENKYIYTPVHHLQHMKVMEEAEDSSQANKEPVLDHAHISFRKMLMNARGIFTEIHLGGASSIHGLTLIYAPAGSGKTTLLTQWARSEGVNCAWLALDGRDNDPVRFWRYAAFALAEVLPAPAALRMLELANALPSLSADAFLDALMNELYGLSEPVKLVLDDYHWIEDDRIHNGLSYLIDYMPPTLHVTIASRKEVPFPASKWLSKRECIVIGADRLQFTRDESEQFYHKSGIMRLTPRQIDRIAERTEGWAAGLQLASLSLRAAEDVDRWIEGFYGDHRDVADYLFQEVLAQLPADLRSFVLTTTVLDRMDAGICSLLTGDPASGDKLDAARRFNLFLIPLDLKHEWFRYHHLFAGFVREHLKRHQPDEWLRLNRLASRGFASRGLLDEAVDHAMAAEDYAEAGRLLEQHIPAVLERGEVSVLLRWFEGYPPAYELSMELSLLYAFVLVLTGHFGQAEARLGSLEASTRMLKEPERLKQLQSGILFVRSNLMFASGDFTNWFAFIGTMLDDILPANPTYYMFNYNKTEPLVRRTALGLKGVLSADTEKIGTLFMGVLAAHGWQGSLIHLYVKQSLVEGYYEWNHLGECRQMLQEMTALTEKLNVPGLLVPMLIMKARLLIADDRTALAHDMPAAKKLMARLGLSAKDKPTFQREYEMMTLVRLLGKQRKENEALRILEHLLPQSEREQLVSGIVENHILQALLKEQLGQKTAALRHLHTALFLGEQNGYIRSFVDEGKPMMSLLGR
ncbi:hypothetical protein BGX30_013481, partial [Mortierella sp. GBA39]